MLFKWKAHTSVLAELGFKRHLEKYLSMVFKYSMSEFSPSSEPMFYTSNKNQHQQPANFISIIDYNYYSMKQFQRRTLVFLEDVVRVELIK